MLCKRIDKKAYGCVMSCEHGVGKEVNEKRGLILKILGVTV